MISDGKELQIWNDTGRMRWETWVNDSKRFNVAKYSRHQYIAGDFRENLRPSLGAGKLRSTLAQTHWGWLVKQRYGYREPESTTQGEEVKAKENWMKLSEVMAEYWEENSLMEGCLRLLSSCQDDVREALLFHTLTLLKLGKNPVISSSDFVGHRTSSITPVLNLKTWAWLGHSRSGDLLRNELCWQEIELDELVSLSDTDFAR